MNQRFIKIFLFFILLSNFAKGQTQNTSLQKLLDNKLLEQNQVADFKKNFDKFKTKDNVAYLYSLFQCEFKKIAGFFYSDFSSSNTTFDTMELNAEEQKKVNQELNEYLVDLKKCELIPEKKFEYFQQKIKENNYSYKLIFIKEIAFEAITDEYMSAKNLKEFAEKLKNIGVVNTKYKDLIAAIDNEKIKKPIDFLLYCEKAIIIDTKNYPNEPSKYLEPIHKETAQIIPELSFTNFDFKIAFDNEVSDNDIKFYNFIVSLTSGGKIYKQKSSYRLYTPSEDKYSTGGIDSQNYYKIFNKILTDLGSPYCLHEIEVNDRNGKVENVFGIMALTKEQTKTLQEIDNYFIPSFDDFDSKLTSDKIEKVIAEFSKIGLFDNLSAEQINEGKENVAENKINNYNEILSAFPNQIYWFDTELGNLDNPYAELIKEFSKISHNEFNPTNISNSFNIEKSKKTTLKFKIGNKSYSKIFKISNDWIDESFFGFIKSVAVENKLKGQFYDLYTGGQDAEVIYLTKKQYDYIRVNKLLTFSDEEPEEDE